MEGSDIGPSARFDRRKTAAPAALRHDWIARQTIQPDYADVGKSCVGRSVWSIRLSISG